jgi:hypothetical protein
VPEGHTHWRMALWMGSAELLREVLCARTEFECDLVGSRDIHLDWRLKVDLHSLYEPEI